MAKKKAAKQAKRAATKKVAPKAKKKAAANGDTRVERARYPRPLPCKIDAETKASKADELAVVIREREEVLEAQRETNATFRERVHGFNTRLSELATSVEKSTELQDVICVDVLDVRTNSVDVIRTDTGEIVETRAAKKEDLQEVLFEGEADRSAKREEEARKPRRRQPKGGEDITSPASLLAADEESERKSRAKPETLPEIVNREVGEAFKVS